VHSTVTSQILHWLQKREFTFCMPMTGEGKTGLSREGEKLTRKKGGVALVFSGGSRRWRRWLDPWCFFCSPASLTFRFSLLLLLFFFFLLPFFFRFSPPLSLSLCFLSLFSRFPSLSSLSLFFIFVFCSVFPLSLSSFLCFLLFSSSSVFFTISFFFRVSFLSCIYRGERRPTPLPSQ